MQKQNRQSDEIQGKDLSNQSTYEDYQELRQDLKRFSKHAGIAGLAGLTGLLWFLSGNKPEQIGMDADASIPEPGRIEMIADGRVADPTAYAFLALQEPFFESLERLEIPKELDYNLLEKKAKEQVDKKIKMFTTAGRRSLQKKIERTERFRDFTYKASETHNIPYHFIEAMIILESEGKINASSVDGAQGLMQLLPSTARVDLGMKVNDELNELQDPQKNIDAGTRYFLRQLNKTHNYPWALASYHRGPRKIEKVMKRNNYKPVWDIELGDGLALETRNYIPELFALVEILRNKEKYGFRSGLQYVARKD